MLLNKVSVSLQKLNMNINLEKKMWLLFFLLLSISPRTTASSSDTLPGCPETCGNISIPYPFGIGDPSCAINEHFLLNCNNTNISAPVLQLNNITTLNISIEEGIISVSIPAAFDCYNESGPTQVVEQSMHLGEGPFRFSSTRNKLTAFGCDTLALASSQDGSFGSGCLSFCDSPLNITGETFCSGIGCCQTPIPNRLKRLDIVVKSTDNHSHILNFNPCGYAFASDQNFFNASNYGLQGHSVVDVKSRVAVEWVVKEERCDEANANLTAYACGSNTDCIFSNNGNGYRCQCKKGFTGNPYLKQGCQDIDECEKPDTYPCKGGKCKNTFGNYTCHCPVGMHGDGKIRCEGLPLTDIISVIAAVIAFVIICLLVFIIFKRRRKEKNFLENGGMLLKHQRVRIFSEAELAKATNNYDISQFLGEGGFGSVYKGVLADHTQVAVKKPKGVDKTLGNQEYQQEIVIVSQVNHRNVVKLLGLCLETKVPLLVYEFISNGTLYQHIHDKKSDALRRWRPRLMIATETALALDYLHSLADPPIIHSDIKSTNILLDDNYIAKVSDFGASVLISPDESFIATKVQGTFGYLDPEYLMTGHLTAKSDVYSFGIVLLELLIGEDPSSIVRSQEKGNIIQHFMSSLESNSLCQILDFEVANEGEMEEIEVVAELAKGCIDSRGIRRPTMKEVADELVKLKKLHEKTLPHEKSTENDCLLSESLYNSFEINTEKVKQQLIYTLTNFDSEGDGHSI